MLSKAMRNVERWMSLCACLTVLLSSLGCAKINDVGNPIKDFDEYINGAWYIDQKRKNAGDACAWDEVYNNTNNALHDIISNTDIDEMPEDEGLYKIIFFYRQIMNTSDSDRRIETTKRYLEPIETIETLEDLYALYGDSKYDVLNGLLNFVVIADDYGCNTPYFWPQSLMQSLQNSNQIATFMSKLGYSKQETQEIIANAVTISKMVEEYWNSPAMDEGAHYYNQKKLDAASVSVPVITILEELGYFGYNNDVLAGGDFCGFLNEVFQVENISALRDHYLVCAVYRLMAVANDKKSWIEAGTDYADLVLSIIMDFGADVLNEEYKRRYLDVENIELTENLVDEIKDTMQDIVSDMDWLDDFSKDLAINKIVAMRECLGGNQDIDDLAIVQLSDDVVENYISFLVNQNNHYRNQTWKEDGKRELFDTNPFELNAHYNRKYALFSIPSSVLCNSNCSKNAAFEERLGYIGFMIAHEMAHTYDSLGIMYDSKGHYAPWMTEKEEKAYRAKLKVISDFFDGKETLYGYTIDGEKVTDEVFADVLAIECCIRLLQKNEKPNYDLFFRTLVEWNACYYTENSMKNVVEDSHLPSKERINYILGQVDQFYETYEIDEESPYYIPEDKRLSKLLKMP